MFKIFGGVARKLFKVLNEVSLIKEIIFIAYFSQGFCIIKVIKHRIEPDNGSKLFWGGPYNFSEPLFKRALADKQPFIQLFYTDRSVTLINKLNRFNNKFVCLNIFKL